MKRISLLLALLAVFNCTAASKGHLIIIGGGAIPASITAKFISLAGGAANKIAIIPLASAEPEKGAEAFAVKLRAAGCNNIVVVIANRGEIDSDSLMAKLNGVTGVFFTGGDQTKLTRALSGTRFLERVKAIYNSGGVIGGTSAGAAIMSKTMITGEELIDKDSTNAYSSIKKGNICVAEGFGFLDQCIIDQHFIKRRRANRLFSVILDNPEKLGIGIDESTAIWVKPTDEIEVIGNSSVLVIDAAHVTNTKINTNSIYSAQNIITHILCEGDTYQLKIRKPIENK
ncbi:MAG: cyanophycinase [Ignavibacteria bacterium]|nr:cyanophycinase [Ignavibacteria bacterium]